MTSTTDAPGENQTLYVVKENGNITITATPEPGNSWPMGYPTWKVNGTAAGTAGSAIYSQSTNAAGTYMVSANCGTSTKTIKVIVWEVISETVATSPSNRKRKTIGVGEEVNLSTNPAILVTWSISGGGSVFPASGITTKFTAGDRTATSVIKATVSSSELATSFSVIEPSGVVILREPGTGIFHIQGTPSVGFNGRPYITPANVSFSKILIQEGSVNAVTTGYFAYQNGDNHPVGEWISLTSTVTASGTKVNGVDTIQGGSDNHKPYINGGFTWAIPWSFKVGTGVAKVFATVNHVKTVDDTGKMTISKGGTSVSAALDDPTSNY